MQELFNGFVEMNDGTGLLTVQIYKDGSIIDAYVGDRYATDVKSAEDFKSYYGLKLYSTIEDFKRGNSTDVYKVWQ